MHSFATDGQFHSHRFAVTPGSGEASLGAAVAPTYDVAPDPVDGPVVVEVTYCVEERVEEFLAAARALGLSRRRTGATSWVLYRDVADHTVFVEVFSVPTWSEHLRQHYERMTGYDSELERRVEAFDARGPEGSSTTRHLVAIRT